MEILSKRNNLKKFNNVNVNSYIKQIKVSTKNMIQSTKQNTKYVYNTALSTRINHINCILSNIIYKLLKN